MEDFLQHLGREVGSVDLGLARLWPLGQPPIAIEIRDSLEVMRSIWTEVRSDLRYQNFVHDLRPIEILGAHRYEQEEKAIISLDSRWAATVDRAFQRQDCPEPAIWENAAEVCLNIRAQLFVEEKAGELETEAQLLAMQVESDSRIRLHEDGTVTIVTSA